MKINKADQDLTTAKKELDRARRALSKMKAAAIFEEFEDAWIQFLDAIEKTWNKAERCCQFARSSFEPWQGKYKHLRKKDELLSYLKHARDAENHTVEEGTKREDGHISFRAAPGVGGIHIRRLMVTNGEIYYEGSPGLQVDITPSRVRLRKFYCNQRNHKPPTVHLGKKIDDNNPFAVAELGLAFYINYINQVEENFFEQPLA